MTDLPKSARVGANGGPAQEQDLLILLDRDVNH